MASESIHEKLEREQRPHVHIKYKVETEGATELKDLPFVVGVMGDFSGDNHDVKPLEDRSFLPIDRVNFDTMVKSMKPQLSFMVKDELSGEENTDLPINLEFNSMEDFSPLGVAKQVPEIDALLKKREKIVELMEALQRDGKTAKELDKYLSDPTLRKLLHDDLNPGEGNTN